MQAGSDLYQLSLKASQSLDTQRILVQTQGKNMIESINKLIKDSLNLLQDKNNQLYEISKEKLFTQEVVSKLFGMIHENIGTKFKDSLLVRLWGNELCFINQGMDEIKAQLHKTNNMLEILCLAVNSHKFMRKFNQN